MKKILIAAGALLVLLALPLLLALMLVMTITGSAAQAQSNPCLSTPTGPLGSGPVRAPLAGSYTATSGFGMRVNPGGVLRGRLMLHPGIDLVSPNRTVVAAMAGRVKSTPVNAVGGYHVYVDVGGGVQMYYAHLVAGSVLVKPGDEVWPGKPLGTEGATGNVTGIHLHFGIIVNGAPVDPAPWMAGRGVQLPAIGSSSTGPAVVVTSPGGSTSSTSSSSLVSRLDLQSLAGLSSRGGSSSSGTFTLPAPVDTDRKDSLHNPPLSIPVDVMAAYKAAGAQFGIPWTLLAGIGMEETGHNRNKNISSAGAQGPMQFIPPTWASVSVDGNGDGVKDINNVDDAVFSAANYLVLSGVKQGPEGVRKALYAYNHASWYGNDVLYYAARYGGGDIGVDPGNGCDGQAGQVAAQSPTTPAAGTGSGHRVVEAARAYLGTPYSWGGGDITGPTRGTKQGGLDGTGTVGFDCSGLVMAAVYRGFGVRLPHSAEAQIQWPGDTKVTATQVPRDLASMQPGDLIAFSKHGGAPGTFGHIGIYIGGNKMIEAAQPGTPVRIVSLDTKSAYDTQTWRVLRLSTTAA